MNSVLSIPGGMCTWGHLPSKVLPENPLSVSYVYVSRKRFMIGTHHTFLFNALTANL
jgi:hypothetical protein